MATYLPILHPVPASPAQPVRAPLEPASSHAIAPFPEDPSETWRHREPFAERPMFTSPTNLGGDDLADAKEVLFTFNRSDHDHTVHAIVFGPDGRLYFNVGDEGKVVMDSAGSVTADRAGNRVTGDGEPYRKGDGVPLRDGRGSDVAALHPLANSWMPAGLERTVTEQELISLVEYLAALGR